MVVPRETILKIPFEVANRNGMAPRLFNKAAASDTEQAKVEVGVVIRLT